MAHDVRVVAILSLMASACASDYQYGDPVVLSKCGADTAGWILSDVPENAVAYRKLAAENSPFESDKVPASYWGRHDHETWLQNSSGEVILCVADGPPWEAWSTQFWKFTAPDQASGELKVADKAAMITIG